MKEDVYVWEIYIPMKFEHLFRQACFLLNWEEDTDYFFSDYTHLVKGERPKLYANFIYDATDMESVKLQGLLRKFNCPADGWLLDVVEDEEETYE